MPGIYIPAYRRKPNEPVSPSIVDAVRQEFDAAGGGARGTGAAIRTAVGGVTAGAVDTVSKPVSAAASIATDFGRGLFGIEDQPAASGSGGGGAPLASNPRPHSEVRAAASTVPKRPRPVRQTSFNDADAAKYASKSGSPAASIVDRVGSYNRAIDTYRDINEMKEADSLGMSLEAYRRFKDRKAFGREGAAKMAEGRMSIADAAAGRDAEFQAGAPQREGQAIQNRQASQIMAMVDELAGLQPGDPKVSSLRSSILAAMGKAESPDYRYTAIDGGVDEIGNKLPPRILDRQSGIVGDGRTVSSSILSAPQGQQPAAGLPADGVYDVPGIGRVTVKGGKAYDQAGRPIQ